MKTRKKTWRYILFGLIVAALCYFFDRNGFNLIKEYPEKMGALVILFITKVAAKLCGWNIASFFSEEMKKQAGEAVAKAKEKGEKNLKKYGRELKGKIKARMAAKEFSEKTGKGKLISYIATQEVYRKKKKENR